MWHADVDLSPAAVERAVVRAKAEGIRNLTREKGFILRMENSGIVHVLLPSIIPEGLSAEEMTRMERETRKQVLGYLQALRTICREWSTVSWR